MNDQTADLPMTGSIGSERQRDERRLLLEIEYQATGSDYGVTSYTGRDQAQEMGQLLGLCPGKRLLDVGAGTGWPGVYLARITGCDVVLVDLPFEEIRTASLRAAGDGLDGRCWTAVGDGRALPFQNASFDAITHCDVLC